MHLVVSCGIIRDPPIEGVSSHSSNRLPPSLPQDPERFPSEDDLQVVLDEISEYREFQ